jgi:hypothetical protein
MRVAGLRSVSRGEGIGLGFPRDIPLRCRNFPKTEGGDLRVVRITGLNTP